MTLLASLTNRIFIAASLLAVVTTGVAVYVVGLRATREAEAELARGLADAGDLVDQQRRTLTAQSLLTARLVADLPRLKGAVETRHADTVAPIAADYQRQASADLLVVSDRDGTVLAVVPQGGGAPTPDAVARALDGREVVELLPAPGGLLQVATVPIAIGLESPDLLGTLSIGMRLDTAMAERFKRATHSEVAFSLDGAIRAATLPQSEWSALASQLETPGIFRIALGRSEYVGRAQPLAPPDPSRSERQGSATALVLQSRTERLGFLRTVYAALGLAAVTAIVLAIGLSYAVARTITRPLAAITATMREVAATGDLTRKIPLREPSAWQDEDARLLATTFNTLTDSVARFQREAAQKDRLLSLGRLSTVIAHEVRNPLMIIKAALRSLRPDAPASEIREAVKDIDEEVDRLNRTVNDVLDFARPPSLAREPSDLVRLCRDAVAAATAGGGTAIDAELPDGPVVADTDPERLRTALINVLSNARQAVDARDGARPINGHQRPAVRLVLDRPDRAHVRLRIVDNGPGIRPEHLPHVFEPYYTTRRTGSGLGLPIARNIVEGLGGTIGVDTAPGRTTVEIVLPL